jgi:hypothetical protein
MGFVLLLGQDPCQDSNLLDPEVEAAALLQKQAWDPLEFKLAVTEQPSSSQPGQHSPAASQGNVDVADKPSVVGRMPAAPKPLQPQ